MGKLFVLFLVAPLGCAPALRVVGRECPKTAPLLADFVATSALLAVSAYTYNQGRTELAITSAAAGMGVALAANLSECR